LNKDDLLQTSLQKFSALFSSSFSLVIIKIEEVIMRLLIAEAAVMTCALMLAILFLWNVQLLTEIIFIP